MKKIKCACLVKKNAGKLLLVRVRDNKHWYLPGGKIEEKENPREALIRELYEELKIELISSSIRYLYNVTGPAYGEEDTLVELICFTAEWEGHIKAHAEISEVDWIDYRSKELLAQAVQELVNKWK